MTYLIELHHDVAKYLDSLTENDRRRCIEKLKLLIDSPFIGRAGCDIKKLVGKTPHYRLRVGRHRFFYLVIEDEIRVEDAIIKKRSY